MQLSDAKFLLQSLKGNECACDAYKKKGMSFCYKCYKVLPPEMQKALYLQFGRGYEEAYEEAIEYLKQFVWGEIHE